MRVGALFAGAFTVSVNAGNAVLATPSLTLITMPEWTPAEAGVPLNLPVVVLKLAQEGLLAIEKPSAFPSASLAAGWNA